MMSTPRFKLALSVQYAIPDRAVERTFPRWQLRRWVGKAMERDLLLTLRLVDSIEGRELNRAFRGKDYATNVLTFVYPPNQPNEPLSGDIALCWPVVVQEAEDQRKSQAAHLVHLIIHGVLHLQGYDHEVEEDAQAMERREVEILSALRFDNPYG